MRIPRNRHGDDGNDPSDEAADDRPDDGREGDVFGLLGDAEVGEAAKAELDPRSQDVDAHEASHGFATFETEEGTIAMAEGAEKRRSPIIEGAGVISVAPMHVTV